MCLSKLLGIFKKSESLVIPHPEEATNPAATMETVDLAVVLERWFTEWEVADRAFWLSVNIQVSTQYPYPAATFAETKQMYIRPEWCNPGVIAHEAAHISYTMLTPQQKAEFLTAFNDSLVGDALVMLLDRQNDYMNTNAVEGHAEIYRYLGERMPEDLKRFYPRLI